MYYMLPSLSVQNNLNQIAQVYQPIRSILVAKTDIGVPQILAARDGMFYQRHGSLGL